MSEDCLQAYRDACPSRDRSSIIYPIYVDELTATAKDNSSGILTALGVDPASIQSIISLKVKGSVNSYDFMLLRKQMINLRDIDLSEASVEYCAFEHQSGYHSENNVIPAYAFEGSKISSIVLPKTIEAINYKAFSDCHSLKSVTFNNGLKTIGDEAFFQCRSLTEVSLPEGLESIGNSAFNNCYDLSSVSLPRTLTVIGHQAFGLCSSLTTIPLPFGLKTIGSYAFNGCSKLKEVKFPSSLTEIGSCAYASCYSLEEIRLPSSIKIINSGAFADCSNIKRVYTYTILPISAPEDAFPAESFQGTLYVPKTTFWIYYYSQGVWSNFLNKAEFDEPYEYFYIDEDLEMGAETPRIEGADNGDGTVTPPDADFNPGSGLVVEGDETQDLGDVNLGSDDNNYGSIIGGNGDAGNITAENVNINIHVYANRWYFFAFPFDIKVANIKYDGNFVVRYYDGNERANNGKGGWKNMENFGDPNTHLKAGYGYIFQGDIEGTLTLSIEDVTFKGADWDTVLESYASGEAQDAGWNFIGNPHTSYFDIEDMGYDHPITVWNSETGSYEAVRPGDDDYVMHPYEAFFVQKPEGVAEITFGADFRQTQTQSQSAESTQQRAARRAAKRIQNPERKLFDITIMKGNDKLDKTRVVLNDKTKAGYEAECDAAKFMSSGVVQIYTIDTQNVSYAINERPAADRMARVGLKVPEMGEYTIKATRADDAVMLKDNLLGITHDFADGAYTFTSQAGTFNNRFTLEFPANPLGVEDLNGDKDARISIEDRTITISNADGLTTTIDAVNGMRIGTIEGNGSLKVEQGIYLITVGERTSKVVVK